MSTEKPTDEDYSRDLHADLAIAEAATKGPWWWGDSDGEIWAMNPAYPDEDAPLSEDGVLHGKDNKAAIASNRQAAPAAMRRAIEAEDLLLEWARVQSVPCEVWQDGGDYVSRVDEVIGRMQALISRIQAARKGAENA